MEKESLEIKLKKIVNIFFKKKRKQLFHIDVERDWHTMLILFVLLCFVVIAINSYFFFKVNRGDLFVASDMSSRASSTTPFDKKLLQKEYDFYNARESALQMLTTPHATSSAPIDPSM